MIMRIPMSRRRLLAPRGLDCDHGGRRHRQAVSQPRRRPPAHHPRRPVRRRLGRFRRGLGARRPPGAHAGRDRDHRQLQDHPRAVLRRCAAGERFHRQGADRRPAGRPGHLLPHPLPGPAVADDRRRADRSAASAPRRATGARSRSSGRATPPARAGASTRRAAACAPTRPCCATGRISSSTAATPSMPTARSRRAEDAERRASGRTS